MDTMDCKQARNLLSESQDGALDAAAAAALAVHIRGCGECAGCADSLLAVRELLRGLPPDPAPPELLARVLAAVEAEDRDARSDSASGRADATKPFLSRFRIPLEAAAAVLLFASVYWYQRTSTPAPRPPSDLSSNMSSEAGKVSSSRPMAAKEDAAKDSPSKIRLPRGNPKPAKEEAPPAVKPRTWTAANLPSVPVIRASTDSERIVPVAPSPGPTADPAAAAGAPAFEERRDAEAEGGADSRPSRVFAALPSRLLRPLPYGRDIEVDVTPESREGAEERIAVAALRLGGIVERFERGPAGAAPSAAGTVRVILPESAAARFLEEMDRIGTIPPEGKPAATDLPAGPRPGTVAYAVRIRVR
jgi:Putative zinc-finger